MAWAGHARAELGINFVNSCPRSSSSSVAATSSSSSVASSRRTSLSAAPLAAPHINPHVYDDLSVRFHFKCLKDTRRIRIANSGLVLKPRDDAVRLEDGPQVNRRVRVASRRSNSSSPAKKAAAQQQGAGAGASSPPKGGSNKDPAQSTSPSKSRAEDSSASRADADSPRGRLDLCSSLSVDPCIPFVPDFLLDLGYKRGAHLLIQKLRQCESVLKLALYRDRFLEPTDPHFLFYEHLRQRLGESLPEQAKRVESLSTECV